METSEGVPNKIPETGKGFNRRVLLRGAAATTGAVALASITGRSAEAEEPVPAATPTLTLDQAVRATVIANRVTERERVDAKYATARAKVQTASAPTPTHTPRAGGPAAPGSPEKPGGSSAPQAPSAPKGGIHIPNEALYAAGGALVLGAGEFIRRKGVVGRVLGKIFKAKETPPPTPPERETPPGAGGSETSPAAGAAPTGAEEPPAPQPAVPTEVPRPGVSVTDPDLLHLLDALRTTGAPTTAAEAAPAAPEVAIPQGNQRAYDEIIRLGIFVRLTSTVDTLMEQLKHLPVKPWEDNQPTRDHIQSAVDYLRAQVTELEKFLPTNLDPNIYTEDHLRYLLEETALSIDLGEVVAPLNIYLFGNIAEVLTKAGYTFETTTGIVSNVPGLLTRIYNIHK